MCSASGDDPLSRRPRKFQSRPTRWGPGRVHLFVFSESDRLWHLACRPPRRGFRGMAVEAETPVTCRRCQRLAERGEVGHGRPS